MTVGAITEAPTSTAANLQMLPESTKHQLPRMPAPTLPLPVTPKSGEMVSSGVSERFNGNHFLAQPAMRESNGTTSPRGMSGKDSLGFVPHSQKTFDHHQDIHFYRQPDSSHDEDEDDFFPDDETERGHGYQTLSPGSRRSIEVDRPTFPMPPARDVDHVRPSPRMGNRTVSPSSLPSPPRIKAHASQSHLRLRTSDRPTRGSHRRRMSEIRDPSPSGLDDEGSTLLNNSRPASISSEQGLAPGFYHRSGESTELGLWNPPALPSAATINSQALHGPITNLPDWASLRGNEPTAHPVSRVQREVEFSILRLVSPAVFEKLLSDPLGRHRFREYLNTSEEGTKELDFVLDLGEHMRAIANLKQGSEALHHVYVGDAETCAALPADVRTSLITSLRSTCALQHQLQGVHSHLIQTIFNSTFQRFIRASITEHSRSRLGTFATNDNGDGLGAAFVLTNPRLRDHPIVLVSPAFCELTGYPQEAILQRNCRFLQGPSTSPASVQRIRDSLNTGTPSIELLLNYKRNGEPFWNLLCIIPLRDAKGRVQYFVGGQVNVTGALTTEGLSFLLGGGRSYETLPDPETTRLYGVEASPTLLKYYSSTDLPSDQKKGAKSDTSSLRYLNAHAAGSQLFYDNPSNTPTSDSASHEMNKNSSGGLMKRLWSRRQDTQLSQSLGRTAESEARRGAATIEEHMDDFAATYSRLALIKKDKREILFVTSSLLEYFDFPVSTPQQLYQSPLLHLDLLSLICGEDRNDTKRLRNEVQVAIRTGKTLKIAVSIRQPPRGLFGSSAVRKNAVLHVSPLRDVENNPSAAIVVFA
ncbi:hypothetical protein CF319_g1088 [Tilletia indica]|uniref:Uncharacterized protein n=1 Tax=Tilletia indica TaxID=43049 RepID=A0A177TPI1_9BASI|nr:hypothetical protein CF319_g1088 [Tilletia indica]KAE8259472.1 hypothetical protein A4X13_0g982 [Tilletia indica]